MRRRTGYLIIVPEMSFSCHGYITGWSALTRFSANDLAIDQLYHDITFDLWRPTPGVNGSYTFVGSKRLDFFGQTLRAGMSVVNGTQFFKFESAIVHGPLLHFQPGDVIGWYLHSLVQSTDNALTVVYKEQSAIASNQLATSSRPVDMYCTEIENAKSKARPPCELSILSDQTVVIPSVIPYINVDYGMSATVFVNNYITCYVIKFAAFFPKQYLRMDHQKADELVHALTQHGGDRTLL